MLRAIKHVTNLVGLPNTTWPACAKTHGVGKATTQTATTASVAFKQTSKCLVVFQPMRQAGLTPTWLRADSPT